MLIFRTKSKLRDAWPQDVLSGLAYGWTVTEKQSLAKHMRFKTLNESLNLLQE